ncbi:MAG: lysylphosphatidylglycerol synthase transmembrane domain-containing protein [Bacteroidia bacterium]
MNQKKAIQYLITFAIGGAFLYFVFKDTKWNEIYNKIQHANYFYIALGMFVSIISHYLRAVRAIYLYQPLGFTIQQKNSFYAVMVGYMMNYIIPRAGEVSRCAVLAKTNHMPIEKSLGTVVTERLVDLFLLALILMVIVFGRFELLYDYIKQNIGGKSGTQNINFVKPIIALVLLGIAIFLWMSRKKLKGHPFFNRLVNIVKGFIEGLLSIKKVKSPLAFIALSVGIWVCYILMMYICLFSMESTSQLNFMDCLVVFAMGTIGIIIPAPGAGAGTYHFAIMTALTWFGVSKDDGIAYATIVHGVQMILLIVLGAIASVLVLAQQKKLVKHA